MRPIVDGISKEFKACLQLKKVNFHDETQWKNLISPIGTPEFALLDSFGNIIYRWIGFTETDEFIEELGPLCG